MLSHYIQAKITLFGTSDFSWGEIENKIKSTCYLDRSGAVDLKLHY